LQAIYAAATVSLAALEVLAHYAVLPRNFQSTLIRIPTAVVIEEVGVGKAPKGWDGPVATPATQEFGRKWAMQLRSAILRVPSTIVSTEWNYVLNPMHPDFAKIVFAKPVPFVFDPRLK
jgi:RES domain-containing protein